MERQRRLDDVGGEGRGRGRGDERRRRVLWGCGWRRKGAGRGDWLWGRWKERFR